MLVDMINQRSDNNLNLKDPMQKFSKVENVVVAEDPDEQQTINFDGERYVSLLYHLNHFINSSLTIIRNQNIDFLLKKKQDKNEELKQEYNPIFESYLKDGLFE